MCLFPGLESNFSLYIKALREQYLGGCPCRNTLSSHFGNTVASFLLVPLQKYWCPGSFLQIHSINLHREVPADFSPGCNCLLLNSSTEIVAAQKKPHKMWQVWTSSWCTHHTRAVTCSSSQGSKADYNKSRQLKNSQQQLWARTCQRFTRWGSLVSPSNVVASVSGGLQNPLWALGSAEDPRGLQQPSRTKQPCFLTKCKFTCQRKEEMAQVPKKHFAPVISTSDPLATHKPLY